MRALVTGSTGFLGEALATRLAADGWQVDGLDVRPGPRTTLVGDLTVDGPWQETAAAADLVVHTAAVVGEKGSWERFRAVNVGGTARVLAAATGRVLHLSSIVVHGPAAGVRTEADPVQPTGNPYTDTKIASEHLALAAAAAGARVTVVRPGDVYGPGSVPWTLRPVQLLRARQLVAPSTGLLTPTYVDDLVDGAVAAATSEAGVGQVFHVTSGVSVPTAAFFQRYAALLDRRLPVVPTAALRALAAPLGLLGDRAPLSGRTLEYVTHPGTYSIAKAERLLGWRPAVDLDEGMRRTGTWLRAEGLLG